MYIQKLEFLINPTKLFAYLNQGKRKDRLIMLQDATEDGYTVVAYGSEVFTEKIEGPNPELIKEVCSNLSARLSDQKDELERYLEKYPLRHEALKLPFLSGLIGFFSYDFGLGFENIKSECLDDRGYPSYSFTVPQETIIWDHRKKEMWVVLQNEDDLQFFESLRNIHFKEPIIMVEEDGQSIDSNLTESEYIHKINAIKEHLKRGETYQVNFSQRFNFQSLKSPWDVYKNVSRINPSKYQSFFTGQIGDGIASTNFWVISNSPERLFKVEVVDGVRRIETRPIKGTIGIKGYQSEEEVKSIGVELLNSEKDQAELEMIVDMSRNDLGRICEFGTVEVTEHRVIEQYSHLLHTASNISGVLRSEVDLYDILRAVFPGASITGCPKKRTMEIIDSLEKYSRGVYCGSMGYLDSRGGADFNIMIRTLFGKENRRAGYGYVMHSGGGIVIDSEPELEFQETFDKVSAFLYAIKTD